MLFLIGFLIVSTKIKKATQLFHNATMQTLLQKLRLKEWVGRHSGTFLATKIIGFMMPIFQGIYS